jgi:hypothetical protein
VQCEECGRPLAAGVPACDCGGSAHADSAATTDDGDKTNALLVPRPMAVTVVGVALVCAAILGLPGSHDSSRRWYEDFSDGGRLFEMSVCLLIGASGVGLLMRSRPARVAFGVVGGVVVGLSAFVDGLGSFWPVVGFLILCEVIINVPQASRDYFDGMTVADRNEREKLREEFSRW